MATIQEAIAGLDGKVTDLEAAVNEHAGESGQANADQVSAIADRVDAATKKLRGETAPAA